jgi:uncharacterized protein
VKQRAQKASDTLDFWQVVLIIFWICVVLFVVFAIFQSIANAPQAVAGRRPGSRGPVVVPGDSGGWGGGWSGGDSGGGGWSGGGGDFGGGGSSGGW